MFISIEPIIGCNVGFEIIDEEDATFILIDIFILRILIEKFKKTL